MTDEQAALDTAGEFIAQVRDYAISRVDALARGEMPYQLSSGLTLPEAFTGVERDALLEFIPEIVDSVLHSLMAELEWRQDIRLVVRSGETAVDLALASDGLAGELYTERGWIARFSQQRHTQ